MLAKVAGQQSIITNIARGKGYVLDIDRALQQSLGMNNAQIAAVKQEMIQAAHKTVRRFDTYKRYWQVGLDMAVDTQGKVWIIEENTGPAHSLFAKLPDPSTFRKIKEITAKHRSANRKPLASATSKSLNTKNSNTQPSSTQPVNKQPSNTYRQTAPQNLPWPARMPNRPPTQPTRPTIQPQTNTQRPQPQSNSTPPFRQIPASSNQLKALLQKRARQQKLAIAQTLISQPKRLFLPQKRPNLTIKHSEA